jgi:hypothetical protein
MRSNKFDLNQTTRVLHTRLLVSKPNVCGNIRAQYHYDTYYLRNLQMLIVSKSVCHFQAFPGAYLEQSTQKVLLRKY